MEWFGIVEKDGANLALLDEIEGVLKPVILGNICADCEDALTYELRQDEEGSYLIGRRSFYRNCGTMFNDFFLDNRPFLVQFLEDSFDFDTISPICDEVDERPLAEISLSDFATAPPNPPTWQSILYDATGQFEWEWMNNVQTAVLAQSDPDIPAKITDLLAYLPTDDPEAQPYREHLTYLLGYHYELSGDEEQAVATYLDFIQQAPNSPWSWLAWARLEPVE